ncbi:hypothetical protein HWV62_39974, partial [Athelia sp. TMB]
LKGAWAKLTKEGEKTAVNVVATGSSVEREIEAVRAEVRRDIGKRQDDRDRDFHRSKRVRQCPVSEDTDKTGGMLDLLHDMKSTLSGQSRVLETLVDANKQFCQSKDLLA